MDVLSDPKEYLKNDVQGVIAFCVENTMWQKGWEKRVPTMCILKTPRRSLRNTKKSHVHFVSDMVEANVPCEDRYVHVSGENGMHAFLVLDGHGGTGAAK